MATMELVDWIRSKGARKHVVAPETRCSIRLINLFAALALAGCALPDTAGDPAKPIALLRPWIVLSDALTGSSPLGPPGKDHVTLRRPTAVSARDNEVYLVDAGLGRIFRYNSAQQTLIPFTTLQANAGMSVYAARDRSVYITDPTRAEVLHFTWDGTQLPTLVSPGNLARPVSVAVDDSSGQVLVADGLYDQFIKFSSLGMTLSVIKPKQALAIVAMATGPDGIYVTDRIARRVVVLGWDGAFRYALGANGLGDPGSLAVSRDNLVFVGDNFDQTVKVYQGLKSEDPADGNGSLLAKVGGVGIAPGSFDGIAGLAADGSLLYVTDSLNARVQIMLISR